MVRWLKRIVLAVVALAAILAGYISFVYFFGSEDARGNLVLVYAAIVANHNPPTIARSGVISTGSGWMDSEPASTKFTTILRRNFPIGSDEQSMLETLVAQGFKTEQVTDCRYTNDVVHSGGHCETRDLKYEWGGVPCNSWLTVRWATDGKGRLINIAGFYGAGCL